jgi:histidinol-phosphate aminotransferase
MENIQTYVYSKRIYDDPKRLNLDWNEADSSVAIDPSEVGSLFQKNGSINLYGEYEPLDLINSAVKYYKVTHQNFIPVPGSDYGIEVSLRALLQVNDSVYVQPLSYKHFEVFATGFGGIVKHTKIDQMLNLKGKPGIIYIVNPNNPTGQLVNRSHIVKIIESNLDSLVMVDEAYMEFAENTQSVTGLVDKYPNLIVFRTFSKAFGLAGLKYGFVFAGQQLLSILRSKINQKCIPGIITPVAVAALKNFRRIEHFVEQVSETKRILNSRYNWDICSSANFFTLDVLDSEKFLECEIKHNIGTRSLSETYGIHSAQRITLVGEKNRDRLIQFCDDLVRDSIVSGVHSYE